VLHEKDRGGVVVCVSYLLNLSYLLLLVICSPWLLYAAIRKGKYREGWPAKFLGRVPIRQGDAPCLWLHAVSVGEVNVLGPLLTRLEQQHPHWTCVISTTTKTGFDLARQKYAPRTVFYCPLDFTWAVKAALKRIRPDMLVLAELELWPNLIRTAKRQGTRIAVVNGRLSDHSARGYRRIYPLVASVLRAVDLVAVQNEEYAHRFRQLGAAPQAVRVTGSIKFDGAETDRANAKTQSLARLAHVTDNDIIFLAGSTQEPEEKMALNAFQQLADEIPELKLIITPRHPERFAAVAEMLNRAEVRWQRRSELHESNGQPAARILLIDAVGELGSWWGLAHIGYVGGSMGGKRGGQNMIEPAGFGAAVCFGPHTDNFRDVVAMLLDRQAAVVVPHQKELVSFVKRCATDRAYAEQLGRRARTLVLDQQGAADRTCALLQTLMAPADNGSHSQWGAVG
jgi:3-deoxy-D-manno-octulosonic-acid transferase